MSEISFSMKTTHPQTKMTVCERDRFILCESDHLRRTVPSRGLSGDTTTCAILTPSTITVTSVGPDERKVYSPHRPSMTHRRKHPLSPSSHGNVPHASLSARREESGSDHRGFAGAFPPARPGIQGCRRSGMADARTCRCRIRLLLPDRSRRRRRPGAGTCL